jgi:hypothetical protein
MCAMWWRGVTAALQVAVLTTNLQSATSAATNTITHGAPTRPNLLLLFPDEWRWDWQSKRAGVTTDDPLIDVSTPNFDKIASSGTVFAHA